MSSNSDSNPPAFNEVVNFRDFGGATSRFGGRLRTGHLFRSGQLANATADEVRRLHELDLALIADLRHGAERAKEPSPWADTHMVRVVCHEGGATVALDIDDEPDADAPHLALLRSAAMNDEAAIDRAYLDIYRTMPFSLVYNQLFARVLQTLAHAATNDTPRLLVHCSAGKDRTGILVSLIQHLLGVAPDDIMAEYLRSHQAPGLMARSQGIAERVQRHYGNAPSPEVIAKVLSVSPQYLQSAFDAMTAQCGSVDGYIESLGITPAQAQTLRERLIST
ncbi:MAG: tyrosine-protein phosphatase [Burkholderiales bacterium]